MKPPKKKKPPVAKPLTEFQRGKQRKARAHFMGRSHGAYSIMQKRAVHGFTLERFRQMVAEAIGKPCPYCGDKIKEKTFSPDHRIPLSRSGTAALTNIEIICVKDNHGKGALTDKEYKQLIDLLESWNDPVAKNDVLGRLRLGAAAKARWSRRWAR